MAENRPEKLTPLLRSLTAVENAAGEEFRRINSIFHERQTALGELKKQISELAQKELDYRKLRESALITGEVARINSLNARLARFGEERERLTEELKTAEVDLARALERATIAEVELVNARIERKKIETLISQRSITQRVRQSAREEVFNDELGGRGRSRGED